MSQKTLKEKTVNGLMWGSINNAIMLLMNLLFGIFLARLLSPSDYGMVGMLTVFSAIAATFQESGFTSALVNKKNVSHEDFNSVFWFNTLVGFCLYWILFFSAPLIANFYHQPKLIPLARFFFLAIFISATGIAHHAVIYTSLKIRERSISQIIALFVSGIIGVALAYSGMAYWGIAIQNILYVAITNGLYWYFSKWCPSFEFSFSPLKEMLGFSSKILLTGLFNVLNGNIFSILLGKFYSSADVGYFTQANKWNSMGISMINNTINGISQPVFSKVEDEKTRQLRIFRKMLRFTAFVSFPCMLGLALIAKDLIVMTITDKWLNSVVIMQLLCLWGAFFPVSTLFSNLIISKGKSNVQMWNNILLGAIQIVTMIVSYPYGIMTMITIYVAINICWLASWQYFLNREIGLKWTELLADICPFILIACIAVAGGYFGSLMLDNIYVRLVGKILITAFIYLLIMKMTNAVVFKESMRFVLSKFPSRSRLS